ncbi:MAG TPA: transposase [Steroidobacteraceae bacterium]|nr:transposase [Steroidobacteraceae bacterium]
MPRSPRIHAPGAIYHVTLRGNHRQDIFFTSEDRALLTRIVRKIIVECGAQLHAYCYMTNHVHALLQVSDTPLSRIMLLVAGRYARGVQARLQTTGHLFEKRYHALLVDADEYLLTLLRYIHLNPVRAKLAASPDDYPWSSHHAYIGRRSEPWVTTEFALRMLGSDRERAIAAYEAFVQTAPTSSPLLECNERDPRILGGDAFARRILGDNWKAPSNDALQKVIDDACARFGATEIELRSQSRLINITRARAWIVEQALCAGITSVAALAGYFNRDTSSIRQALKRRRSKK